ncbi:MAG TPA: YqaA family protein [Burkholderiaceae bacterium]|nr:YqaA family protein [Burkholderiaceae bacterium]
MFDFTADAGLAALFFSSFVAATIFPGGSELVLIAVLHRYPEALWQAIAVATVGNTLGALTSYGIGWLIPNRVDVRWLAHLHRYGYWALLFAWLPLVGDGLAIAAGWLRLNPWLATLAFAIGKGARYLFVAMVWLSAVAMSH